MNRRLLIVVGVLVGLAGITWAAYAWVHAQSHVSTDDAYVESAIAPLAAKVSGHVVSLTVEDNKPVKAGEVLLRIDPRDYQAKVDQMKAAYYDRPVTVFAAHQRMLCNKCHAKD